MSHKGLSTRVVATVASFTMFITHLRLTATGFVISAHLDDREGIKMCTNSPLRNVYCIIYFPKFLNASAGIPIAC